MRQPLVVIRGSRNLACRIRRPAGSSLVAFHQGRVAANIRNENRRKPSLEVLVGYLAVSPPNAI